MHYRNGREAKNGDRIVYLDPYGGQPRAGILYGAQGTSSDCNAHIAQTLSSDPIADLKNCVHVDDIAAAIPGPAQPPAK